MKSKAYVRWHTQSRNHNELEEHQMTVLHCSACENAWQGESGKTTYRCPRCLTTLVPDTRQFVPYAGGLRKLEVFREEGMTPLRPLAFVMAESIEKSTGVEPDQTLFPEDYYEGSNELYGYDFPRCPACGELMDYCQGHGEIGDPVGYAILQAHDNGDHSMCSELGCEEISNEE